MNAFQLGLTQQLLERFAPHGFGNVLVEIAKGPDEPTVQIRLVEKELHFWIYEDGAGIAGPGIDRRFEMQDYKELAELAKDFAEHVARHASGFDR